MDTQQQHKKVNNCQSTQSAESFTGALEKQSVKGLSPFLAAPIASFRVVGATTTATVTTRTATVYYY